MNVSAPSGNQAGFLQESSGISQAFDLSGGMFTVGFLAEFRNFYGGNTVDVMVDGNTLFAFRQQPVPNFPHIKVMPSHLVQVNTY